MPFTRAQRPDAVPWGTDAANGAAAARLFDHLVGEREQRQRNGQAERLGGLEFDDQIDLGGLLHRQIGRLLTFEMPNATTESLICRRSKKI